MLMQGVAIHGVRFSCFYFLHFDERSTSCRRVHLCKEVCTNQLDLVFVIALFIDTAWKMEDNP